MAPACHPSAGEVEAGFLGLDDHQARVSGEFQGSSMRDRLKKDKEDSSEEGHPTLTLNLRISMYRKKKNKFFFLTLTH